MQPGQKVTIYSYSEKQWKNAEIVGIGTDAFTGQHPVLIVRHSHFENTLDFYATADSDGRHRNVGNAAFWIERETA